MAVGSIVLTMMMQAVLAPAISTNIDQKEEPVCRRIEVTGSIARKERVCKTRAEWQRLADSGNSAARAIVDHSTGRPSGL